MIFQKVRENLNLEFNNEREQNFKVNLIFVVKNESEANKIRSELVVKYQKHTVRYNDAPAEVSFFFFYFFF